MTPRRALGVSLLIISLAALLAGCGTRGPKGPKDATTADKARYHYNKGIIHFERQLYAQSMEELHEAIHLEPANADYRMQLSMVHFALGDWASAEGTLRDVLQIDPYRSEIRNMLGAVLSEQGRREEALSEFQEVLEDRNYATPEKIWINIALLYEQMNNMDEAVSAYRRSLDRNPRYARAHYGLAQVLDRMDRLDEAIAEYEVASADYQGDPQFHYRVGLACFRAGRKTEAREHFLRVIREAPGTTDAAHAEELLELIN